MSEPVNLEVHRGKKQEKCDFCGEPAHPAPLLCPRVRSVVYHDDGAVEVHLWLIDDEPDGAA